MTGREALEKMGLTPDASEDDVHRRWKELAYEHHPDRGGDPVKFNEVYDTYQLALIQVEKPLRCDQCNGDGKYMITKGFTTAWMHCGKCDGTGDLRRKL